VAVIGFGHLGKWHCEKVEKTGLAELRYIVETNPTNAQVAKARFPGAKVIDDIEHCLDEIDAVVIVTPTTYHHSLVEKVLDAKKHIFCEKPLVSNYQEGFNLKNHQYLDSVVFQVGHIERFHAILPEVRRFIKQSQNPCSFHFFREGPFSGRGTDVDVFTDLMIHDIDLVHYLTGESIKWLSANGYKMLTSKWDYVTCVSKLSGGSHAIFDSHRNAHSIKRGFVVNSELGQIRVDSVQNLFTDQRGNPQNYAKRDHLLMEHKSFYRSITEGKESFVSFEDGLKAVRICDEIQLSLMTKSDRRI
jgi:predicted dehydrogenase